MSKTLSIDTHEHDPAADQALYDLLKEADAAPPKTASPKIDQDPGESPGDDDVSTVGMNPDMRPDPEDRPKGSVDASWGEKGQQAAAVYSREAARQFRIGREELLDKLFDGKASSEGAEQKLVSQHLSHAASGQFETSAPMLTSKAKTASVQTLLERVRSVTGRH